MWEKTIDWATGSLLPIYGPVLALISFFIVGYYTNFIVCFTTFYMQIHSFSLLLFFQESHEQCVQWIVRFIHSQHSPKRISFLYDCLAMAVETGLLPPRWAMLLELIRYMEYVVLEVFLQWHCTVMAEKCAYYVPFILECLLLLGWFVNLW